MSKYRSPRWIPETARQLEAAGADRGRAWSLAQLCEHLALAVEETVSEPRETSAPQWWRALGPWQRLRQSCAKQGLLLTGWFPQGVPSPDMVMPTAAPDFAATVQRLEIAIEAFEQKLKRPAARWVYHPLLGCMSGRQWRRFHAIHAAHHFTYFRTK